MSSIKSLTTRFIYPFFYTQNATLSTLTFREKTVWQPVQQPKEFYRQEILQGLENFIFGDPHTPQYFTVNPELANQWFGRELHVRFGVKFGDKTDPKESFSAKLSSHAAIEIFLSPQGGVGILSIPLEAIAIEDKPAAKRFNYRLSQHLPAKIPQLFLPQPENAHHISTPPAPDSPLTERLGKRGGEFTLIELRDFLLSSLQITPIQEQFSIYSVVQFEECEFSETTHTDVFPLLVSMSHVEEPHHVGSSDIPYIRLNSHHWSGVGTLGAVHFVADQAEDITFNQQRIPTVFNKYFLPYLAALLQRLILQHILKQAQQNSKREQDAATSATSATHLQQLHNKMLDFMLNNYLSEVSSREVINQYYELAKRGLRVEQSFEVLRRALHDADFKEDMKFQCQSTDKNQDHLNQLVAMQRKIEWLEVFFASYYAGALAHYVSAGWFGHWFASASTLIWAFFGGGIALWLLKPWSHEHHDKSKKMLIWAFILIVVALAIWLSVGFCCYYKAHHQ